MDKLNQVQQEYNLNSTIGDQDETKSQLEIENSSQSQQKLKEITQNQKKYVKNIQKKQKQQLKQSKNKKLLNNSENIKISKPKSLKNKINKTQFTDEKENQENSNQNTQKTHNLNLNINLNEDIDDFIENENIQLEQSQQKQQIQFIEEENSPLASNSLSPQKNLQKSKTLSSQNSKLGSPQSLKKLDTFFNQNKEQAENADISPSKLKLKKSAKKINHASFLFTSPAFPSNKQVKNSINLQMAHVKSTVKEYMDSYTNNLKQSEDSLTKLAQIVNGEGKKKYRYSTQRNTVQGQQARFSKFSISQSQSIDKYKKNSLATPSNRMKTSIQRDDSFHLEMLEENNQENEDAVIEQELTPRQKQKKMLKEQYKQFYKEKLLKQQPQDVKQNDIEKRLQEKFQMQYNKLNSQQQSFKEYKKKRDEAFKKICGELGERKQTFSKFGFKSSEKSDVPQIKQITKQFDDTYQGSMQVIDLWTDNNIKKFLGQCQLLRDKMMINKMAELQKKQGTIIANVKPVLLSRKEENKLIKNIYKQGMVQEQDQKVQKELTKLQNEENFNVHSQNLSKRQSILEKKHQPIETHKNQSENHPRINIHKLDRKQSLFSTQSKKLQNSQDLNQNQQQDKKLLTVSNFGIRQNSKTEIQPNLNNSSSGDLGFLKNKFKLNNFNNNNNTIDNIQKNKSQNMETSIVQQHQQSKSQDKNHKQSIFSNTDSNSSKNRSVKQRMLKNIIGKQKHEAPQLDEEYYLHLQTQKNNLPTEEQVGDSKWGFFKGNKAVYCKYCKQTTFMRHVCEISDDMINEYQYDKLTKIIGKIDHIHDKNEIEYSKLNKKISKLQDRIFSKRKNRI